MEMHRTPVHTGVEENESADTAAEEATGWRKRKTSCRRQRGQGAAARRHKDKQAIQEGYDTPFTAPTSKDLRELRSATKATLARQLKTEWDLAWEQETHGRAPYRILLKPAKKVLELHRSLPKTLSSVIIQLRTEKIG
jgi:hypothetical protein